MDIKDISVSGNYPPDKRRIKGRVKMSKAYYTALRKKRREDQEIFFIDRRLFGSSKFGSFIQTKSLFNEGYDYILKSKGKLAAEKYMKDIKERPYNNYHG